MPPCPAWTYDYHVICSERRLPCCPFCGAEIKDPEAGFLVDDRITLAVDIWEWKRAEARDEELEQV